MADNLDTWRQIREREERIEAEVSAHFVLQGQRVAHEVNNPLAIIRNYLTLLSNDAARAEPSRPQGDIEVLREEIERLAGIVRNLAVDVATPSVPDGQVDLDRLLEGMRTLYEGSLFRAAEVRLELGLPRGPALAYADRDNVKQIVFNLWKNAAEAMKGGGTLLTEVTPHVNCNGTRYAQIRIRDSGPGLPPAVLDSLFRPLDSEAPALPGATAPRSTDRAGLGLSIVLALVERNRGLIACESRAGEGTVFTLLIPETPRTDR
jgi:signal transduction histidine kinase